MNDFVILDALKNQMKKEQVSFHVPGHKNGKIYKRYMEKDFYKNFISLDVTELHGTDNLHAPEGMIKEAQERAAAFFGADHTFFLVNGTSAGIISMLMAVADPKDQIIIPRDCHKSVIHGLILGDILPVYMHPEIHGEENMPMGISPEIVEKAILDNPKAKAVFITYPNYYGICSDIREIAKIVHRYDKILIVDEAHGAHLNLSKDLPISALEAGADMVAQSTHKTLLSFTQSSMVHVKSKRIHIDRLKYMLQLHQSSSPSYLLMNSLDMARAIVEKGGNDLMKELLEHIRYFHKEISSIEGIRVFDKDMIGKYGVVHIDITKLVIDLSHLGIGGVELERLLRTQYDIFMEMSNINSVLGVATIGNDKRDFDQLLYALLEIGKGKEIIHRNKKNMFFSYPIPKMKIGPREATYGKKSEVEFLRSVGKISGEYIIPYPPGIPILCPGEEISEEMIQYVDTLKTSGINMIGMSDMDLMRIKVIE